MSVGSFKVTYYVCKCDTCGNVSEAIEKTRDIYNAAQAARSIGWSFGRNGRTQCPQCRAKDFSDRHIDRWGKPWLK